MLSWPFPRYVCVAWKDVFGNLDRFTTRQVLIFNCDAWKFGALHSDVFSNPRIIWEICYLLSICRELYFQCVEWILPLIAIWLGQPCTLGLWETDNPLAGYLLDLLLLMLFPIKERCRQGERDLIYSLGNAKQRFRTVRYSSACDALWVRKKQNDRHKIILAWKQWPI